MCTVDTNKARILSILHGINRSGMDKVIEFLENGRYFTANCYGHHFIGHGGVAQHSLEVMDYLLSLGLPEEEKESLIIVSLFHDLGKSIPRRSQFGYIEGHGERSVAILEALGFDLKPDERYAIYHHHDHNPITYLNPLRGILTKGDCHSTGEWKRAHPEEVAAREASRARRHKRSRKATQFGGV